MGRDVSLARPARQSLAPEAWRGLGRDVATAQWGAFRKVVDGLPRRGQNHAGAGSGGATRGGIAHPHPQVDQSSPAVSGPAVSGAAQTLSQAGKAVGQRASGIKAEYKDVKQGYTALYETARERAAAAAKPVRKALEEACPEPIKARCNNIREEYGSLKEGYAKLLGDLKKKDFWQTGAELGAAGFSYASGLADGVPANLLDGTSNELWRASVPGSSAGAKGDDAAARLGDKADAATLSATAFGRIKVAANLADLSPLAAFGNSAYSINWGKNACYSMRKAWTDLKDHYRQGSPLVIADSLNLAGGALNGVAAGFSAASPLVPSAGLVSSGLWLSGAGCGLLAKAGEKLAPRIDRQAEKLLSGR